MIYIKTPYPKLPRNCWRCYENGYNKETDTVYCRHIDIFEENQTLDSESRPQECPLVEITESSLLIKIVENFKSLINFYFKPNFTSKPGHFIFIFMELAGYTEEYLSRKMKCNRIFIKNLIRGNILVTEHIAESLENTFDNTSKKFWLNLQKQ